MGFPVYIKAKIFAAASSYAPLVALLKNGAGKFRWYDTQLDQGSEFPAVVVQVISNPKDYAFQNPVTTSWYRVQFTIWDHAVVGQTGVSSGSVDVVFQNMLAFFAQLNLIGIPELRCYPNLVMGSREGLDASLEPPAYLRTVDVRMFNLDTQ